jgi:hypothetical protein
VKKTKNEPLISDITQAEIKKSHSYNLRKKDNKPLPFYGDDVDMKYDEDLDIWYGKKHPSEVTNADIEDAKKRMVVDELPTMAMATLKKAEAKNPISKKASKNPNANLGAPLLSSSSKQVFFKEKSSDEDIKPKRHVRSNKK